MISHKTIQELEDYAELDGTEWGEGVLSLIDFSISVHYLGNKALEKLVEQEIEKQLKLFQSGYEIKEVEEQITVKNTILVEKNV